MPTPPDGLPWWLWAAVVIVLALIGSAPALVAALVTRRNTIDELAITRRQLAQTQVGVSQTLGQVQNTHPLNLRDDLDDKFKAVAGQLVEMIASLEGVRDDVGGLHSETRDLRQDVTGIRTDARRDRRLAAETRTDLTTHLDDVPKILDEAFAKHGIDCMLRSQQAKPPTTGGTD